MKEQLANLRTFTTGTAVLACFGMANASPTVDPAQAQNIRLVQDVAGLGAFERAVGTNPAQVADGTTLACANPSINTMPTVEATLPEIRIELAEAAQEFAQANEQGFRAALASGPGAYQQDFGGAQRDWIAGRFGEAKAVLNLYVLYRNDFKLSTEGLWVLCAGQAGVNWGVDYLRFFGQEMLKAHLINKRGMSRNAASWASFAVSQTVSLITTPLATYGLSYALSGHFAQENNQRRQLMARGNSALDEWDAAERRVNHLLSGRSVISAQVGPMNWQTMFWDAASNAGSTRSAYLRLVDEFRMHDDSPFSQSNDLPPAPSARRLLDSYPATNYLRGSPNMTLMWSAMYSGYLSRCEGSTFGSTITVRCPIMSAGSRSSITLRLNPTRVFSGKTYVSWVQQAGNGVIQGAGEFPLDVGKLPPI